MKTYMKCFVLGAALIATALTLAAEPVPQPPPPGAPPRAVIEKQIQQAQDQVRQAEDQYRQAQYAARDGLTQVQEIPGPAQIQDLPFLFRSDSTGRFGNSTLIIPKENPDPKSFSDLEEDLNVMAHILDKAVGHESKSRSAMGIKVQTFFGSPGTPRNLYIEGYGALFFLRVNYPLLPPPAEAAEPQPKTETNSEWEEARRELSHPAGSSRVDGELWGLGNAFSSGGGAFGGSPGEPAEDYDAERVETLKQDLAMALKNAANIRKLKSDEFVTVVVTGRGISGLAKGRNKQPRSSGSDVAGLTLAGGNPAARESKLVLRVRRSDAEAFQKDKLSADDFKKKVSTILY